MTQRDIRDLATSHGDILMALFQKDPLSMKEIADKIDKDKSTITALVDKLISFGYVTKQKDPDDSRIILVSLTEKGKKLQTDFEEISARLLETVYQGFEETEKEQLITELIKIKNNL
jgi:DNA-binding MarR family transcriptional regulator